MVGARAETHLVEVLQHHHRGGLLVAGHRRHDGGPATLGVLGDQRALRTGDDELAAAAYSLGHGTGGRPVGPVGCEHDHQVETARAEVAQRLAAAADGGIEARFAELAEQVSVAERRSAQAVEQIGRQVLSMAEAVGRKLTEVDARSAGAIDQVGTEVARIAGAVELRLARQEHTQAEAFERLQAELAKLS